MSGFEDTANFHKDNSISLSFLKLMYKSSFLKLCIFPQDAFSGKYETLPGLKLEQQINKIQHQNDTIELERKLHQSCHKLCLMWRAGINAIEAEADFYSRTTKDAPALFGEDAININYHLEGLVLFARSALDVASSIFGCLLPDPFTKKRYDSFNKLVKEIINNSGELEFCTKFENWRNDELSWLSIISNTHKGRSLRDKITHQMDFPIDYIELHPPSEKETAIVWVTNCKYLPLDEFIQTLSHGVIDCFLMLEAICINEINKNA
ncbi:MAG: hypothetical protein D3906_10790 [Candidatus Electrothrix sp. AUS1_2]|nr:hypothetical protein [Candidatus Electrothrix sp. AUS1_2]